MIVSYCKKCQKESTGAVCSYCQKKQPASSVRDVWRAVRVPVADAHAWRSIISALLLIAVLLFGVLFLFERLLTITPMMDAIALNQLITYIVLLPIVGVIMCFFILSLQGREEIRYALDTTGVHIQVWHRFTYTRCIFRLQAPCKKNLQLSQDGTKFILSDERHMMWQDINEIKYIPSTGIIRLYHTPHLAPVILRVPEEEYDTAEKIIKKYSKIKD